ncbi:hypothetical protein FVER14953_06542 [Fusarium verticillioides]|nr:hypothetical protein FVER14953_06542 [Fusarium verticillioides]
MATIKIKRGGRFGGQKISHSAIVDSTSLIDLLIAIQAYGVTILPVSHQLGLEIVGQGLSGHIHQATADVETMLVFKKGVPNRREVDDDQEQDWYHLITQIAVLQHKDIYKSQRIINLLGITFSIDLIGSIERAWPLLITRKATLGHLGAHLSNTTSPVSVENRRKFFTEVAEAVLTLHRHGIFLMYYPLGSKANTIQALLMEISNQKTSSWTSRGKKRLANLLTLVPV